MDDNGRQNGLVILKEMKLFSRKLISFYLHVDVVGSTFLSELGHPDFAFAYARNLEALRKSFTRGHLRRRRRHWKMKYCVKNAKNRSRNKCAQKQHGEKMPGKKRENTIKV